MAHIVMASIVMRLVLLVPLQPARRARVHEPSKGVARLRRERVEVQRSALALVIELEQLEQLVLLEDTPNL